MSFLLYHETTTSGMVSTPSHIENRFKKPGTYVHDGHFLVVDGEEEDVELILQIKGYRLATAQEQQAYRDKERKKSELAEIIEKRSLLESRGLPGRPRKSEG